MALTRVINEGIGSASAIAGEGTASTNLQQGLVKCWSHISADGASILDSLNVSSHDDDGTGDGGVHINNDMGSVNYVIQLTADDGGAGSSVNSIDFSFNIASYTDRATGSLYGNFTNNMGSAIGYTVLGSPSPVAPGTMNTTNSNRTIICSADTAARFSSNGFSDSDNAMRDLHCHSNAVFGDLA